MVALDQVTMLFSRSARSPKPQEELTLAEVLLAHRLPPSLFQAYEVPGDGSLRPIPISTTLAEVHDDRQVILQCIRNTDIDAIEPGKAETVEHDRNPAVSMYDFQWADDTKQPTHRVHTLGAEQAQEIVFSKICEFLTDHVATPPLVAGISGGGDSNTLVQGTRRYIAQHGLDPSQVVCFTLTMKPIWPESATDRAAALCAEAGFTHRVLHSDEIATLLEMSKGPDALWRELSSRYSPDLAHFFATFLINLAGRAICEETGSSRLMVGYNREDIAAELLFCLVNGRRPMPYPIRRTGGTDVLMPVWDVPKGMLDACYPRFSEENYSERVDSSAVRRSSIYYMAHGLDALVPSMSLSLMTGVKRLMDQLNGWEQLTEIGGSPLMHTGYGDQEHVNELLSTLARYFPAWHLDHSTAK
ncbi:hypothetical protein [Streptomyces sp. NPDC055992]|uniref:hypothetical protein n=1 Tax=Streptomyces sp. NPDC055992 TaxID=3345673 RepID=UPI0035DE6E6E